MIGFTHDRYFHRTVFLVDTDDANIGYNVFKEYLEGKRVGNIHIKEVQHWNIFTLHAKPPEGGGKGESERGSAREIGGGESDSE